MNNQIVRKITTVALLSLLAGGASVAQAQQVQARVVTTSPVTLPNGGIAYNVTYEYAGKQYNTRTSTPPGASIMVNATDYGATTSPVAPQSQLYTNDPQQPQPYGQGYAQGGDPQQQQPPQGWANVVPEPGMVVGTGGGDMPPPGYVQAAPVAYAAPVVYPAPAVYPAYYPGYVAPYAYPPIGISLGFGYSRGWGGGYGGYGHWR